MRMSSDVSESLVGDTEDLGLGPRRDGRIVLVVEGELGADRVAIAVLLDETPNEHAQAGLVMSSVAQRGDGLPRIAESAVDGRHGFRGGTTSLGRQIVATRQLARS